MFNTRDLFAGGDWRTTKRSSMIHCSLPQLTESRAFQLRQQHSDTKFRIPTVYVVKRIEIHQITLAKFVSLYNSKQVRHLEICRLYIQAIFYTSQRLQGFGCPFTGSGGVTNFRFHLGLGRGSRTESNVILDSGMLANTRGYTSTAANK